MMYTEENPRLIAKRAVLEEPSQAPAATVLFDHFLDVIKTSFQFGPRPGIEGDENWLVAVYLPAEFFKGPLIFFFGGHIVFMLTGLGFIGQALG